MFNRITRTVHNPIAPAQRRGFSCPLTGYFVKIVGQKFGCRQNCRIFDLSNKQKLTVMNNAKPFTVAEQQIFNAEFMGELAFRRGLPAAPAKDRNVLNMIKGRQVGETPEGHASTVEIFKAWNKGWNAENAKYQAII